LVFVDAYKENPVSHRYVIANGRSAKSFFSQRLIFVSNTATAPKICYDILSNKVFKDKSVLISINSSYSVIDKSSGLSLIKNGFLTQLYRWINSISLFSGKYFSNNDSISFKYYSISPHISSNSSILPSIDSKYCFNKGKLSVLC